MIKSSFIIYALFVTISAFVLQKNFPKELAKVNDATATIANTNGTMFLIENISTPMVNPVELLKRTINESDVESVEDQFSFESSSFTDEDSFEKSEEFDEIKILPGFELTEDFSIDVDEDLEIEIDSDFCLKLVLVLDEPTKNKNETFSSEEEMKESDF
uniref:Uncharacterized protein n=1 Tax=Panagrolaimus sp. ES5 TaxID=591445 RepID=A0AC34FPP4_9BILA